jgi:hypothetical protein
MKVIYTIVLRQVFKPYFPEAAVQGKYSVTEEHLGGIYFSALY